MKGYRRRAMGKPNYWKLAVWNELFNCWQDGKRQYDNREEALIAAKKPGQYRLSFVEDNNGRHDVEEFVV